MTPDELVRELRQLRHRLICNRKKAVKQSQAAKLWDNRLRAQGRIKAYDVAIDELTYLLQSSGERDLA